MPSTTELTEGSGINTYVQTAQNAKGKQAAFTILQAIGVNNVYVFGELLAVPSIQQLESGEDKKHLDLLKIFAYGTYNDFKANSANLPALTPAQLKKLKQLTIVSLASTAKIIPYSVLHQQLDIQDVRELEDLIIDAIYQGVIQGRLDQRKKQLEIEFTMGRDLKPEALDQMISRLDTWQNQSETLLRTINDKMKEANFLLQEERKHREEFEKKLEAEKKRFKEFAENELSADAAELIQMEEIEGVSRGGRKGGKPGRGKKFF